MCVWQYTNHISEREKKAKQAEIAQARNDRIERLDTEISFRFSEVLVKLERSKAALPEQRAAQLKQALALVTAGQEGAAHRVLYPAFAQHILLSLLGELRAEMLAAGDVSERLTPPGSGTVNQAIRRVSIVAMLDDPGAQADAVATELLKIIQAVRLSGGAPRWNSGFIYTDCAATKPFC